MPPKHQPLDADISLVTGQSGSGKTIYVKRRLEKQRRVIVWDVKGEYAGYHRVESAAELPRVLMAGQHQHVAFVPRSMSLFDHWCKCAYHWGNCAVVAEELADVTTPGKAPEGWGWVLRRGRERRLVVFGITHRPSESDKTILGNATTLHVCAMARADDRKYMARELDVPQAAVDGLELGNLEWIEKDLRTRKITQGSLKTNRVTPYMRRASPT